jgi:hypothetical protein
MQAEKSVGLGHEPYARAAESGSLSGIGLPREVNKLESGSVTLDHRRELFVGQPDSRSFADVLKAV